MCSDAMVGGVAVNTMSSWFVCDWYSLMSCICPYIIHHHLLVTAIILVTHMPSQVLVQLSLWSWPQQSEEIHMQDVFVLNDTDAAQLSAPVPLST